MLTLSSGSHNVFFKHWQGIMLEAFPKKETDLFPVSAGPRSVSLIIAARKSYTELE